MAVRCAARQQAYRKLVKQWRAICDYPISKEAKRDECMLLLREFIDEIAWARRHGPTIPLRFYADMLVLEQLLQPRFATDELATTAIWPGDLLVQEWLEDHRSGSYRFPWRISERRLFTFD